MPIYLKLGDFKGDVQDARYKGWIQLESANLGKGLPVTGRTGGTGGTGGSGTSIQEPVIVTMLSGSITVKLVQLAGQGKAIPEAVIVLDHGDKGTLTITMKDVFITNYQFGAAGGGGSLPTDTFTLAPLSITFEHGPALNEGPVYGPAVQLKKDQRPKWKR